MIYAIVYGKGHGCSKCDALKRRLGALLKQDKYKDIQFVFHDVLTEDGLTQFLKAEELNPNRIPALVMADENGFLLDPRLEVDEYKASAVPGYIGIQTDYDTGGGLITPPMIQELLDLAVGN